ncbi:VOC family protein [Frankia sp. QA3]|uniref:VOC family protein n=1 Tax=Frankia sp. QA3 TaxID=710111 RepID=UPI000269C3AE|nr:VOC family protein [Frankia sp. QA3]EIV94744.1 lactoylglutathione lyase family protein [Frankia sp. QA3]
MPTRENIPAGAPCWVDLMTSDAAGAKAFYGELFGWEAEESAPEFGGYTNLTRDGVRVGGLMPKQPGMDAPDGWSVYLSTPDAEKTVAAATEHGGGVIVGPMAVADLGVMAVVTDPSGAAIGMWQPGLHSGFGVVAEPGAPGWFELLTRNYAAVVPFYRDVFGWDVHVVGDTPEFRYSTFGEGDAAYAGIMDASGFLPDGVPAHWSVYFATADTDATLERAAALGGSVVLPAEDTPYGRLAAAADPTGAVFKLLGPNVSASAAS